MAIMTKEVNPLPLAFPPGRKVSGDQPDGELGEFETHVFPFVNRLFRTALILTGSPGFAKNLLHATFSQARHGYYRFHNDNDFGLWMFRLLFDAFGLNRHRIKPRQGGPFTLNQNGELASDSLLAPAPKNTPAKFPFQEMTLPPVCAYIGM